MSLWTRFLAWDREVSKKINVHQYFPGYFNKHLFLTLKLWIVGFTLIVFAAANGTYAGAQITCEGPMACLNPTYNPSCGVGEDCGSRYMYPGQVIGSRPSWIVENAVEVLLASIVLGFGINHILYMRKVKE